MRQSQRGAHPGQTAPPQHRATAVTDQTGQPTLFRLRVHASECLSAAPGKGEITPSLSQKHNLSNTASPSLHAPEGILSQGYETRKPTRNQ